MNTTRPRRHLAKFYFIVLSALLSLGALIVLQPFEASGDAPFTAATYSQGLLHLSIPYQAPRAGSGQLTLEVLDPDDNVLGRVDRHVQVAAGQGRWQDDMKLLKPLPLDDLVWQRVRHRFEYDDRQSAGWEGTDSISQIIRMPVVHVLGQQSYLSGGAAAVRVIVTDSSNEVIAGRGTVRIELLGAAAGPRLLFTGRTNHRGTTEAQFRFPAGLVGNYQLHYAVDTSIGSTEYTESVRVEDKVSILLTTEKPIYQPGQTIHVRALALDRADHRGIRRPQVDLRGRGFARQQGLQESHPDRRIRIGLRGIRPGR